MKRRTFHKAVEPEVVQAQYPRRGGTQLVAEACCGKVRMTVFGFKDGDEIVLACPDHGASMIKDGKISKLLPGDDR
jgi:hypothetical protein